MENKKEMTIPNVSAATDAEQSLSKCTDNSIVNQDTDFKGYEQSFEEMQREILRQLDPSYLKTVSMTTLYDTVFEVQTPLIDGLLQRGTYLFVGSPKVGKSFMMAQLAYHISTGTPLWEYKVRKATVLYFALEDDYPRLQKRLFQMFGAKETGNLYFATECKTVNGGLEEQIRGFMREHPDTGLIIIDTLKRVREAGGADYSYASDYDVVARLKALADSYKVSMLIVHHTRKQKSEDIFDMISGTNGLMGAADGAFVLSKDKRTSNNATLDVAGRDQQDNINPNTISGQIIVTDIDTDNGELRGNISTFRATNVAAGKGSSRSESGVTQTSIKSLLPMAQKYKASGYHTKPVDLAFFDGKDWVVLELKAGGDLDSSNAPANVEKLLTIYAGLNVPNSKA